MKFTPPTHDGVSASCVVTPMGNWRTTLDFLSHHFAAISGEEWADRLARGDVIDEGGARITRETPFTPHRKIYYYRSVANELRIPFEAQVLFQDDYIVVADKPHFLPVAPAGRFVQESLLVRLKKKLGIETLSPAHRIDRDTAGLVLFIIQPETRDAYHRLFRERLVEKRYEAIASTSRDHTFPVTRCSRLIENDAFMQMREAPGAANAETHIAVIETCGRLARYALRPVTGQKHQLRVHMAALGIPIVNDRLYPNLLTEKPFDDFQKPLQLLAKEIAFDDPITGQRRQFSSDQQLMTLEAATTLRGLYY